MATTGSDRTSLDHTSEDGNGRQTTSGRILTDLGRYVLHLKASRCHLNHKAVTFITANNQSPIKHLYAACLVKV